MIGEDFRSLLNTNSRENSEITIETTRMIDEEISNQMSRKLKEIKNSLNTRIQDAFCSAIAEKILLSIQNMLVMQERVNYTMVDRRSIGLHDRAKAATSFTTGDRRSSGLQRNSEVENSQKSYENRPRKCFIQENREQMFRQSSIDSVNSEQNHDMVTGANPTPHMVPEFLTGSPMQSREPLQRQNSTDHESQETIP